MKIIKKFKYLIYLFVTCWKYFRIIREYEKINYKYNKKNC